MFGTLIPCSVTPWHRHDLQCSKEGRKDGREKEGSKEVRWRKIMVEIPYKREFKTGD